MNMTADERQAVIAFRIEKSDEAYSDVLKSTFVPALFFTRMETRECF